MNITDFAIGNYVLLNGQPERVRGIQEDQHELGRHVLLLGQGKVPLWYTLKEIEPIILYPNILELCGYVFDSQEHNKLSYKGHGYSLTTDYYDHVIEIGGASVFIKTLHQFINLFHLRAGVIIQIDYDKLKAAI